MCCRLASLSAGSGSSCRHGQKLIETADVFAISTNKRCEIAFGVGLCRLTTCHFAKVRKSPLSQTDGRKSVLAAARVTWTACASAAVSYVFGEGRGSCIAGLQLRRLSWLGVVGGIWWYRVLVFVNVCY